MDLTQKILLDYSYYLKIERAMSPNTVEAYTSDLEGFFNYVGVEPAQVTTQDILDYLAEGRGLSKRSQSRQLSAFRSFFDWLVMEGDRPDNPCDPVDTPKIGRYLPEVLSVEEVSAGMKPLGYLSIVTQVAPMFGLLGTVTGMIGAFDKIGMGQMGSPEKLADNIGEAMITTAAGLIVAIPAMFAYFGFKAHYTANISRISSLLGDLTFHLKEGVRETRVEQGKIF